MYNRYIPQHDGSYQRRPVAEQRRPVPQPQPSPPPPQIPPQPQIPPKTPKENGSINGFLKKLLQQAVFTSLMAII